MLIGRKEMIDDYCKWLFPFLERLEQRCIAKGPEYHSNRIYGYISEYLLDLWIIYRRLSVYEMDYVYYSEGILGHSWICLKNWIVRLLKKLKG